ncbi:MAG: hypothetical protein KDA38_14070 [Planctomycetales bacterium]|nr:hypothetical protein [Planctomycetales bacterium]
MTLLFQELCQGRADAMQPLWNHYFPRLMRVAGRTLADSPQRVAGADDAVQSAFMSFWRQAEAGRMTGNFHRDNLWAFLSVLTVRKARKQMRWECAVKRGGKLTRVDLDVAWDVDPSAAGEALQTLTPQEFDLYSEELLLRLDESLRPFAVLKLMGYTDLEIADRQGCTERTVQRKMRLTRLAWEAAIEAPT